MEKKNFMLLLALSAENGPMAKAFLARVKADIDPSASPLWIDSRGVGVFVTTEFPALKIARIAWPESLTPGQRVDAKDFLIVQVGPDWYGGRDTKPSSWLNARYPKH